MLAALIATRTPAPPPPPVFFYTNQFIAAITTFKCITITRRAAFLTTNLPIQTTLNLSLQGEPAILDLLNLTYYRIINYLSSNANMVGTLPAALYLSNQIAATIVTVTRLQVILASLPVSIANRGKLAALQAETATALAVLKSLGTPVI